MIKLTMRPIVLACIMTTLILLLTSCFPYVTNVNNINHLLVSDKNGISRNEALRLLRNDLCLPGTDKSYMFCHYGGDTIYVEFPVEKLNDICGSFSLHEYKWIGRSYEYSYDIQIYCNYKDEDYSYKCRRVLNYSTKIEALRKAQYLIALGLHKSLEEK